MSLAMSREERQAFLAGLHVGVVSVADGGRRAPLTVPIWYRYEPGSAVTFVSGGTSRKVQRMRETGRFSLCVQAEDPPYKYVTVEGPVVAIDPLDEEERRSIARRYLGPEAGDAYIVATAGEVEGYVVVRMRPEHWLSADYGKLSL